MTARNILLQLAQVLVQPIQAAFPEAPVALHPLRRFAQACRFEPSRPPLRVSAT